MPPRTPLATLPGAAAHAAVAVVPNAEPSRVGVGQDARVACPPAVHTGTHKLQLKSFF